MIECPFCRTIYVDNTVFCEECGNYLLKNERPETDPLDTNEINWIGEQPTNPRFPASFHPDTPSLTLSLKIGARRREIEITPYKTVTLGRLDPALDIFPEVDLSLDSDLAQSVSRRHATLSWQGGEILVEDMASANGTFLNGHRLVPFLPETVSDGDVLQLGRLLIEVRIGENPPKSSELLEV